MIEEEKTTSEVIEVEKENNENVYTPKKDDKGNFGWAVLGFFFPIVGLVLFLVWKNERPGDSKMAGTGALVSVIVEFVFGIMYALFLAPIITQIIDRILDRALAFII